MKNKINNKNDFVVCPICKKEYPRETVGRRIPICDKNGHKIDDFEICVCENCYLIYKLKE